MKRTIFAVVFTSLVFAGLAWAQTVDQGMPGTQGSWPVSVTGSTGNTAVVGPDGGAVVVQNRQCSSGGSHKITTAGVAATSTPATQLANRTYVVLCNSLQNTGTPLVKCRVDGTAPVMAAGNIGDVLGIGDCIQYDIGASVVPSCIADAATTYVTSYECG